MKSLSILLLFLTVFTGAMAQEEETCSENTIVRLTMGDGPRGNTKSPEREHMDTRNQ